MNSEPSYLPLLRRVANAECNAAQYLSAWAQATPREDVRCVIGTIALREAEHSMAFRKRIDELGFTVSIEEAPETADRVAIGAAADLTDLEKFEKLGLGSAPDPSVPDGWVGYFHDHSIDIATGELLGRFIAEKRDSVRLLADCHAALVAAPATVSEAEFRADLHRDGYSDEIRITTYDAGVEGGELHTHPFSARLLVLNGELILRGEAGPQRLRAGQCCEVPAGTRHTESTAGSSARVLAGVKHHT